MPDDGRIRRALLFMPGDDLKKIAKGSGLGADSVIMDLEDGVALNRKTEARKTILHALWSNEIDFGRTERLVRVNPADTGWQDEDVAATVSGRPDGYVLPKVESAQEVQILSARVAVEERKLGIAEGTIKLLALIETARGVVNLREIAGSDPRLVALLFGAEDLAGSIGAVRSAEGMEVFYAKSAMVIHAAAFNLQAIDSPYIDFRDTDGLRAETEIAVRLGYVGKMAIHPVQVEIIADVFTPSDEEIEYARKLIEAHQEHQQQGIGAFAYEGKMVDMPMIRSAQRILARARAAGRSS